MPGDSPPEIENEPVALRRVRFVVAYDGAGFHGFADNAGVRTVVGVLGETIGLITRTPVQIVGAGRTDRGVHSWGQVITCDLPPHTDLANLVRRVNMMHGPQVVLRSASWTGDEFHARFSAKWRHYRYTVLNSESPNPFMAAIAWHVFRPLSLPAMQLACDPLIGEHDFTSFCRKPPPITIVGEQGHVEPSMSRRVMLAKWTDVSDEMSALTTDQRVLRFDIRANAFCHQMVRSIVGTMIQVGTGRLHAGDVTGIMRVGDRRAAPILAPAHGLNLWDVGY
jgi:tRNA pseudouridine38-40 synthase